jgi:hypothetical protein
MAATLDTGQQWDAPNGSAPRQWIAVEGLISYGQNRRDDRVPMDGQRLASLSPDRKTGGKYDTGGSADFCR